MADEVLCGYGRTGEPFAIQHWGVEPDIITMGKGIGSGYAPLAATLVSEKVLKPLARGSGRFVHGLTYSGTPVACFVGLHVFQIMRNEGLFTRAEDTGDQLFAKLDRLAERHEVIGEVRGKGLLAGVEFVADRRSRQPFPKESNFAKRVVTEMCNLGVSIAAGVPNSNFGKDGDHIQISPPLVINAEEIAIIVDALDTALERVLRR